ncbi:ABC transporter permease, partial [Paraburkholderia sp. SIMBA_053]
MSTLTPAAAATPVAQRDGKAWLVSPALLFILALFVYPFVYGLALSFSPME